MQSNNYQLLSLIIGYEDFQKYVKEVRNFLGIPEGGFSKSEDSQKWTHTRDREDERYLNSPEYKKHNRDIRAKMAKGEIDERMGNEQLKLLGNFHLRTQYFSSACEYVIDKFNLPSNMTLPLRVYILNNVVTYVPIENFAYVPSQKNEKVARIEIYSSLTKEEEKSLLRMIKDLTKNFPKISKLSKSTVKRLSFEEWCKNKDSYAEKITAKDIAKEHLKSGKKKNQQKVYDAKRLLDKQRKKRFG